MGIYKITFTHDFSEFENCIQIPDYDEAQNYFKANADDRKCLLVAKKKSRLYMVIYYEQKKGVATHPWNHRNKTWLKDYHPWNTDKMGDEDSWMKAVIERFPELSIENTSPKKSAAKKKKETTSVSTKKQKQVKAATPEVSVEESKKIINENFKKLQTAYRAEYKKDFLESEDFKMFFRKEDLDKILEWNKNASSKDDLIDLCSFYELKIGNPETADLVILGNNPGAKGEFEEILNFERLFAEMEERKINQNIFYPMSSLEAMELRPWFPNRLIYGVGGTTWKNRQEKNGVLYPFMENKNIASLCKYAKKIATLEMVPYHTKTFASGESFLDSFDLFDPAPIEKAMKNGAVIIALFRNSAERWSSRVPELQAYPYFYVNHKKEVNNRAEANASLSKQSLRRYSEFDDSINNRGERYPEFDAYSEIVKTLKEKKNW